MGGTLRGGNRSSAFCFGSFIICMENAVATLAALSPCFLIVVVGNISVSRAFSTHESMQNGVGHWEVRKKPHQG